MRWYYDSEFAQELAVFLIELIRQADLPFRLVNDQLKDDTLSEVEKRKQIKVMSLSFPPMSVTDAK